MISQFFNWVDFGLTPFPLYTVGKSSTIAAMVEHGLPVIVSWGDIAPEHPIEDEAFASLIWRADEHLFARLMKPRTRSLRPGRNVEIAKVLLARLSQSES